jgi:hypothetical protein
MNSQASRTTSATVYVVAILGALLIVAALVWLTQRYTRPAALDAARAAERAKALVDLRAAEAEALSTPAWIDQSKGLVRLPIEEAMKQVEQVWGRDPAAGRSNLVSRVEKATAPAPKAPEQPSQFE